MSKPTQGRLTLPPKVRSVEQDYINKRRDAAKSKNQKPEHPVGLALSGGGIRSATFALGVLQKLAKTNSMHLIDYMTTVSGGGYIGSCLSSLMACPKPDLSPEREDTSIDQKAFANFDLADNFPLTRADQMHHLRKHGSFLILREGLFRKDVLRAFGLFLVGILSTFLVLALPLLSIVGFSIAYISLASGTHLLPTELKAIPWLSWGAALKIYPIHYNIFYMGLLSGICLTFLIPFIHSIWKKTGGNLGETEQDIMERTCLTVVFTLFYLVFVGTFATLAILNYQSDRETYFTFFTFLIPVCFSLGNFLGVAAIYSLIVVKNKSIWTLKSRSLIGATIAITFNTTILFLLLGFVAFCIWAVLGAHLGPKGLGFYEKNAPPDMFFFIVSVLTFVVTRLFALRGNMPKSDSGPLAILASKIPLIILQIAVPLFLFCTFMVSIEWTIKFAEIASWENGLWLSVKSIVLLVAAGYFIDVNRLSIHYFYRDRLSETYLQTERHESGELKLIREDSEMKIADLNSQGIHKANPLPYHIILCSLNLAGSRDLARRTRKSDHFIFSREYCGSSSTGYVPTKSYRKGTTKLSTAMTISGAAVGSNMGFQTSFARAFALTLFNVRLGYWLVNPRVYDQDLEDKEEIIQFPTEKQPKTKWLDENWKHKIFPFLPDYLEKNIWWPWFLRAELFGATNSQGRLVNLSDGGHTGDNIGLYPLFQRRCRLIIASDAECDPGYSFSSLINAVNQIYIDENVEVEIDVTQLRPDQDGDPAKTHFLIGRINYPEDPDRLELDPNDEDAKASTGWLIFLKSSLIHNYYRSLKNQSHHAHDHKKHEPPAVQSFAARNRDFPHETTADQFFDDDQFEAYRALGFHVATSMFDSIEKWRKTTNRKETMDAPSMEELIKWCAFEFQKANKPKEKEPTGHA